MQEVHVSSFYIQHIREATNWTSPLWSRNQSVTGTCKVTFTQVDDASRNICLKILVNKQHHGEQGTQQTGLFIKQYSMHCLAKQCLLYSLKVDIDWDTPSCQPLSSHPHVLTDQASRALIREADQRRTPQLRSENMLSEAISLALHRSGHFVGVESPAVSQKTHMKDSLFKQYRNYPFSIPNPSIKEGDHPHRGTLWWKQGFFSFSKVSEAGQS